MAVIAIKFASIEGESTLAGYEGLADAVGISESMEMKAAGGGSGRSRGSRVVGVSKHSDIELARFKDIASPKLAEACSSGSNLGSVDIHLFRTLESGTAPYMIYHLTDTFVARVEHETLEGTGSAFSPHVRSFSDTVSLPASAGAGGLAMSGLRDSGLQAITISPVGYQPKAAYTNREVERIVLSPASVTWEYVRFLGGVQSGSVIKGWNIAQNAPVA